MQEDQFVFYLAWELSACLPSNLPNHQPPGYIGQHSFSLLPDETVTYVGGRRKVHLWKQEENQNRGHMFQSPKSKHFHVFQGLESPYSGESPEHQTS